MNDDDDDDVLQVVYEIKTDMVKYQLSTVQATR
jgi:hypothetical protein